MGTKPKKSRRQAAVLNGSTAGVFIDDDAPKRSPAVEYSPEIAAAVCEQLAEGRSLRSICEQPGMPCRTTIVRWLVAHEDFRLNYHQAREVGFDHFAEGLMRKATDVAPDMVQSVRLEVDTGKWLLSKMSKRYNDRIVQEHTLEHTLQAQTAVVAATVKMTPIEVTAYVQKLLAHEEATQGLSSGEGMSDADRLKRITNTGKFMSPEMYEAINGPDDN
jgi:hypothetical protein